MHSNSLEAFAKLDFKTRKDAVRAVYMGCKEPKTDRQILDYLYGAGIVGNNSDLNMIKPAITRLIKSGDIVEVGSVKCPVTNYTVRQCVGKEHHESA